MFTFFQNKNQILNMFHVFVRGCLVSVIENRLHVLKNKKTEPNLFLFSSVLVFENKYQFLNRFHVFVRGCLVSVTENRLHVIKNKKKGTKLVLVLPCSCFFITKTSF